MSELQRRIAFAAVAIPVGVGIIWLGDALLAALLGIIAALGAREFFQLSSTEGAEPMAGVGIVLAALAPLAVHAERLQLIQIRGDHLVVLLLALVGATLWLRGPARKPALSISLTLFGVAYTGVTVTFGYLLRHHEYAVGATAGATLLLFPIVLTWSCDTAAFAAGRTFGRNKLMPTVSPGKTIEGAAAGLLASILLAVVYEQFVLRPVAQLGTGLLQAVLFGAVVGVAAQAGDLAESMFKRAAGAKDSSAIIPGHGGILDRFDSLYFVLPLAYLILRGILIPVPRPL